MRVNKKLPVFLLVIIAIALPLLLILINQSQNNRSNAATADKLETESGTLNGNAIIQTDASASDSKYILLGTNYDCSISNLNTSQLTSDGGYAWYLSGNFGTTADNNNNSIQSTLRLFENGIEIGPAHSLHADIRNLGNGRFSHFSNTDGTGESLRFSSKDNSDPRSNGKTYSYCTSNIISPNTTQINTPTPTPNTLGKLPAFPGAEGGGAGATGGRGGAVIKVTNLNDSGPGSLRACAESTGTRTCIFTVSGIIYLLSDITINNPNLTIAGQTAPGGIAVYLGKAKPNPTTFQEPLIFRVQASNVIIRYMRLWGESLPNQTAPQPRGSIGVSIYKPNVIVDHNDITWFTQEGVNVNAGGPSGGANISLQWNIIGENIYNTSNYPNGQSTPILMVSDYSHSGKGGDPYGVTDMDLHHNLITTASHRMPNMACQTCRIINNAIYNFGRGSIIGVDPSITGIKASADYIGNHYKPGPLGPREWKGIREIMANQGSITSNSSTPTFSIFISGNRSEYTGFDNTFGDRGSISPTDSDSTQWNMIIAGTATFQGSATTGYIPLPDSYKRSPWTRLSAPASGFDITVDNASNLPSILTSQTGVGAGRYINCSGVWVNNRDSAQTRILNNYLNGTGPSSPVTTANAGNPLPILGGVPSCTDTDNDGMPDIWEGAKGLNPNNASDRNNLAPNGYTWLENYINGN